MAKKDPTRSNPPPRGKTSIWPLVAFIVVLVFAAKGCNTDDPDITPVPPSQTEQR